MRLNSIILILLVVVAVPLYIYDVLLVLPRKERVEKNTTIQVSHRKPVPHITAPVKFTVIGKSPFLPYKEEPKPVVAVSTTPVQREIKAPKEAVNPPRITITGIMWNPTNPVVMLSLPDGSSAMAKTGQVLMGAVTITKIEQNSIDVLYKDVKFTIRK